MGHTQQRSRWSCRDFRAEAEDKEWIAITNPGCLVRDMHEDRTWRRATSSPSPLLSWAHPLRMRFFFFCLFLPLQKQIQADPTRFRACVITGGSLHSHACLDAEFSKVVAAAIQKSVVTLFTVLWRGHKGEQD